NFVVIALVMGLGVGVQATVARRRGEGRDDQLAAPLTHGLFIAALLALPLSLLCWLNADAFISFLSDDPAVVAIGSDYFGWRMLAVIAAGCNFAFRGYWNGIRQTGRYLHVLVAMHVFNGIISYVLIFV